MSDQLNQRILVISLFYAPKQLVGAKRFTYLSTQFEKSGIETHILTLRGGSVFGVDKTMPVPGHIHRAISLLPFPVVKNNFFKKIYLRTVETIGSVIDPYIGWLIPAFICGFKIIRKHNIDVIIVTGPPYTPLIVGALLSKFTGKKLILDYRDPWLAHDWKGRRFKGKIRRFINEILERWVVQQATDIVVVSTYMYDDFARYYPSFPAQHLHVVTNAFTTDEYKVEPKIFGDGAINILYAGNFYGERKMSLIVEPLAFVLEKSTYLQENLQLHVFGGFRPEDEKLVAHLGLKTVVHLHKPVPYSEMLSYINAADILLLISGKDVIYALPYKLFDYLGAKHPIFAIAPKQSAVSELLKEVNSGEVADINDKNSICAALDKLLNSTNVKYSYDGCKKFSLENTSKQYIDIIRSDASACLK